MDNRINNICFFLQDRSYTSLLCEHVTITLTFYIGTTFRHTSKEFCNLYLGNVLDRWDRDTSIVSFTLVLEFLYKRENTINVVISVPVLYPCLNYR